jgi:hypothetical protein
MATDVTHPLLDAALQAYKQAVQEGLGSDDWTRINKV